MNENIMMGVILNIDKEGQKAFLRIKEDAHFIEAHIKEQKFNYNVPRGSDHNATFTGELSISLDEYPCEILTIDTSKIQAALDGIEPPNQNQMDLFTKQEREIHKVKLQIHQDDNPEGGITLDGVKYEFFNPEAYEQAKAGSNKLLPPHVSKKQKKKWHKERKAYEALKKYPSMYLSEEHPNHPENKVHSDNKVEKTLENLKEEIQKESDEYVNKLKESTKEPEEPKIDLTNEFNVKPDIWDVGEANKVGTLADAWEEAWFIGHHNETNDVFTVARTKVHPENGCKYVLAFDKKKTAEFFYDKVMEHGNLKEQIADAKLYRVSQVLKPEQGVVPCLWIKDAWTYLNSKAAR